MPQLSPSSSRTTCCCTIVNSTILVLLAGACVFFSIYDVKVEGIIWSLGIYMPCLSLFLYGLFAWHQFHRPTEQKREEEDGHATNGNASANDENNHYATCDIFDSRFYSFKTAIIFIILAFYNVELMQHVS